MSTDTESPPLHQAPQSLALDARATAMLKAMGVNWRWPAPLAASQDAAEEVSESKASPAPPASQTASPSLLNHGVTAPSEGPAVAATATPTTGAAPARPQHVVEALAQAHATPHVAPAPTTQVIQLEGLNWEGLQQAAADCQSCGMASGRVGQSWGQGGDRARWLFVTPRLHPSDDGPDTIQGDELKLLQSLWRAMGINEADVFVTSLTKCRAGLGMHASASDTEQCLAYLRHQVQWLQPDMIVALGLPVAHAMLGFNDAPLAQWRSQTHQWLQTPTIVTYPLDALLRRPVDKAKWWVDMCLAMEHLNANAST